MSSSSSVMGKQAAHELEIALTQFRNNSCAVARQFPEDQKCQDVCQSLVETAATVASWMRAPGIVKVTVSMQPQLFSYIREDELVPVED